MSVPHRGARSGYRANRSRRAARPVAYVPSPKSCSTDSLEVRLLAGAVLDAFTAAVEHWAGQDEPEDLLVLTRRALAFQRLDEL
ncbi:hypothetical protein [Streptomyces sp. NBC_01443]|uniref:acyl-CoA-like ligand-binding transcription factor n=1 Tax=Streptomyces sp. NBC_01443 TaxID=2903868 RepID=UPI00224FC169|nr:hypothetical protein [Streptomyces sp. NBC_01443]MCX4631486.1 hypothetical protein [Streptomyces sp. NBC_01443]